MNALHPRRPQLTTVLSYAGVSGHTRATGGQGPCYIPDGKSNGHGGIGGIGRDVGGRGGTTVTKTARCGVFPAEEGDANGVRNGTAAASGIYTTTSSRDGSDRGEVESSLLKVSVSDGSGTASERSDDYDDAEEGKSFDGNTCDIKRENNCGGGPAERVTVGVAMGSKTESMITGWSSNTPPELDCLRGR